MTAVGMHLQYEQSTSGHRVTMENWVRDGDCGAMVVFDSEKKWGGEAIRLARLFPRTIWIYRRFIQGDGQYKYMTPTQFADEHMEFVDAPSNLFIQIDNEPNAVASAAWMLATMTICRQRRIKTSIGGYGVGQPSESEMLHEGVGKIIKAICQFPGWHILNLHEYTKGSVFVDFARYNLDPSTWPKSIPPNTTHHLMGRWMNWVKRASDLGVKFPDRSIVIGEFGFDYVAAVDDGVYGPIGSLLSSLPTFRRWAPSIHPERYAGRQLKAIFKLVYDRPEIGGVVVFCWSDHPTDWGEWNVNYVDQFVDEVKTGFEKTMTTPTQPPTQPPTKTNKYRPGKHRAEIAAGQLFVNLRETADGADRGDLKTGDIVDVYDLPMTWAGKYYWIKLKTSTGDDRWIADTTSVVLKPLSTKTIPQYIAEQRALLDAMEAAYNRGEI